MTRYELQPIFLIRIAGRAFDHLEALKLSQTAALARELNERDDALDLVAKEAIFELKANPTAVTGRGRDLLGQALGLRLAPPAAPTSLPKVEAYRAAFAARAALEQQLQQSLEREYRQARRALIEKVTEHVRPFAVFSSAALNDGITRAAQRGADGPLDSQARKSERHLLMYLQRVCAKNDTMSEFGPIVWGRIDDAVAGAALSAQPGISQREVYVEKWVVEGIARRMNEDPAVRPELAPRRHPNGWLKESRFLREDTRAERALTPAELALVKACDGKTPAHQLGSLELLTALAAEGVLRWEVEPVVFDAHRMELLAEQVRGFRPGAARDRWLSLVDGLLELAHRFGAAASVDERWKLMETARSRLLELSVSVDETRELYAATNPIGEDCTRTVDFRLGRGPAEVAATDAAPWYDLWCDTFAYAASLWGARLAELHRSAPRSDGRVRVPAFMAHCQAQGFPINGKNYGAVAQGAFDQVRLALKEQLSARPLADEWELTAEDCHVVRRKFSFTPFGELIWPSADLMLSASSLEAVARGDYEWVISELHAGMALLQHGGLWACPDVPALGRAMHRATQSTPFFNIGVAGADASCHTTQRPYLMVPELWTLVSSFKGRPDYRYVPPAEAEVVLDERGPDLRLRALADGRDLGSLVRHWGVPSNGMHPFDFKLFPTMPRLRMGRVVVQRAFWTVSLEELKGAPFKGLSGRMVAAFERVRAAKRLPRFIFVRPSTLGEGGRVGQDKDAKPIFVDLESYHSLDAFHHALTKHGRMEAAEMLPQPDRMIWREESGRYTHEIRTLLAPVKS